MTEQTYWAIEGPVRLAGAVQVLGGKNSAPKHLVASLLTEEPCVLSNVPQLGDVAWALDVCRCLGSEVDWVDDTTVRIRTPKIISSELPADYGGSSRLPILLLGPLLSRLGHARVPHGGGCQIGSRPVAYHIEGLSQLGAQIEMDDGWVEAHAAALTGGAFDLPYPSVGATETLLLTAVLASGETRLTGIAVEPEVLDLIDILQQMGASIRFEGERTLAIRGVEKLRGYRHHCMTDRNECASWACAAVATDGDVTVRGADRRYLEALLQCFDRIGAGHEEVEGGMRFFRASPNLGGVSVDTSFHPALMSDWQPPLAVVLTQAHGRSTIHETVYEDRFHYVQGLQEMGARVSLSTECLGAHTCRYHDRAYAHSCVIEGPTPLRPATLRMPDLRGGFAYVMAALLADGVSHLYGVDHIARGYSELVSKAQALGANIRTLEGSSTPAPSDSGCVGVA